MKAREIWSIAEQVRRQFPSRRPIHCLDLERLIRTTRKMSVNGIEIVTQWDLDRSVRDGKGREALGVTEADPALPGVLLISLNADLIAGRDYLKRSTQPMSLAMLCSTARRCCSRPVSRHSPW